jgi:hypothetical protein
MNTMNRAGGIRRIGNARRSLAIILFIVASGCGNLTAGGVAEGEAMVAGDGTPTAPAESRIPRGVGPEFAEGGGPESDLVEPPFEGTVTVSLSVHLLVSGGDPLDLSGGEVEVTVDIQGAAPASLGLVTIPTGTYSGVRVVFTAVEATVTSGLPPLGIVSVDFGGEEEIVVEEAFSVQVDEAERAVAGIGLGAPGWIETVLLDPLVPVPASVFQGFVDLSLAVD